MTLRVLIAGCGTGVGKTYAAAALIAGVKQGSRVVGLKPIESGYVAAASDAARIAGAAGHPLVPPLYRLDLAASPHLAARHSGIEIDLAKTADWVEALESESLGGSADVSVVETAGGLFSPLNSTCLNVDLVRSLSPAVCVMVAANRLGVLHDVLAALSAAEHCGVRIDCVLLSEVRRDDSSASNPGELARFVRCPVFTLGNGAEAGQELVGWILGTGAQS